MGANGNTLVVNESTKFVFFDSAKEKVTVETGLSNLPTSGKSAIGYYVAEGTGETGKRLNASVVFSVSASGFKSDTAGTDQIVFVDVKSDKRETSVNSNSNSKFITTFEAWNLDGTRRMVTYEGTPSGIGTTLQTGLYKVNEKNEIKTDAAVLTKDGNKAGTTVSSDNPYFYVSKANAGDYYEAGENELSSGTYKTAYGNFVWRLAENQEPVNGGNIAEKDLFVVVRTSGSTVRYEVVYIFTADLS